MVSSSSTDCLVLDTFNFSSNLIQRKVNSKADFSDNFCNDQSTTNSTFKPDGDNDNQLLNLPQNIGFPVSSPPDENFVVGKSSLPLFPLQCTNPILQTPIMFFFL